MTKLALGVVIALAVLTGEARASFMDGNGLYKACSSNSYAEQDICLGYIEGATDYEMVRVAYRGKSKAALAGHSPPETIAGMLLKELSDKLSDKVDIRPNETGQLSISRRRVLHLPLRSLQFDILRRLVLAEPFK